MNSKFILSENIYIPIISGIIATIILVYFHNTYWYPQDEGFFGHVADRINAGEIYGVDIQSHHPGYHHYLNAFIFKILGRDLVFLRYPLVLCGILQAIMTTYMLRKSGIIISILGGLLVTSVGLIQFLDPSPNWYALFFAFCCVFILTEFPKTTGRILLLGFITGLCFGFRHPSGIFLGFGVLIALILDKNEKISVDFISSLSTIIIALIMLTGIAAYHIIFKTDIIAILQIGIAPIMLLLYIIFLKPINNTRIISIILFLGIGFILALAPLVLYQALQGDILT